jgi:WD40 repeat protein
MRVFDTGRKRQEFSTLAFGSGGRWLAAGGGSHPIALWDLATGADAVGDSTMLYLYSQQVQPAGADMLLVSTGTGFLAVDFETDTATSVLEQDWYAYSFAVDRTGTWVVCSHITGRVLSRPSKLTAITNVGTRKQKVVWSVNVADKRGERVYAESLACLADGKRFLSAERVFPSSYGQNRRRLAIRSRKDGGLLDEADGLFGYADSVIASPTCDTFVVVGGIRLRAHRVDDLNAPPHEVRPDGRKHFTAASFHPSGQFLMAASNDATVKLYDTRSWQVARTFTWDIGRMRGVTFSADGTLAAAGSDAGKVVVWDVDV